MGKRKSAHFILVILCALFLSACQESANTAKKQDPEMNGEVEVNLQVPEKAEVGETILISATVTQDGKEVADADEIKFEIWKEGADKESKMYDFTSQIQGTYAFETSFEESAVYNVQVHVTARRMHVMPKKKIMVGDVLQSEGSGDHPADEHSHHE